MITPDQPTSVLPGIGPQIAGRLKKLEIETIADLLEHYPSRFLDLTKKTKIAHLKEKVFTSFQAEIKNPKQFRTRTGKLITQATAIDNTGQIMLTWFNSPYLQNSLKTNTQYLIAGKPSYFGQKLTLISPQIEIASTHSLHTSGLVPIYPQTSGLTSKFLRRLIDRGLKLTKISDPIPNFIIQTAKLIDQKSALESIHFPKDKNNQLKADKRLSFNEHLRINLNNQIESNNLGKAPIITIDQKIDKNIKKQLPFKLTPDQQKTIKKLYQTISQNNPSHTLVQGDTGSGKTILAIFCAAQTINNHLSFCLLAPTQILADQHFATFNKYLGKSPNLILITGKSPLKSSLKRPTIFIGTHALLNQIPKNLTFPLGCLFIDEQHKFGVKQRDILKDRQPQPHLINLTATPIPRTLALGIFGDINIFTIKHAPTSHLPTKTWVISNQRFQNSFTWLKKTIQENSKIFVVCPYIKESKNNSSVKSALNTFKIYQKQFGHLTSVNLIHGQLKPEEKATALSNFQGPNSHLLISTPIIEVGIDIPSANIIIIHSAERFGLAQLHQLRGRVGRGSSPGYCLLIPSDDDLVNLDRLNLLTKYKNGLTLSKLDLKLRGTGEIAGLKQHGHFSVKLKHFWDKKLYHTAKIIAKRIITESPDKARLIANKLTSW
jgi:ATP-dependent DNA helicase RecG